MSNRGRHKKKIKTIYVKIQKLIDDWNSDLITIEELNKTIKQTIYYESRKT